MVVKARRGPAVDEPVVVVAAKPSNNSLFKRIQRYILVPASFLILYHLMMSRIRSHKHHHPNPGGLQISNITANPAGPLLKPFLRPRVPGSTGSAAVQAFLTDHFVGRLGWHLQTDSFQATTPIRNSLSTRPTNFTNLVFTKDINAPRRLVLAVHYDSKPWVDGQQFDGQFIGATDSAWPCALLTELARAIDPLLKKDDQVTLQVIFFDGEEAHVHWGPKDSLYGSKHLAQQWKADPTGNAVDGVDLFILFDLLGAAKPTFRLFPKTIRSHYQKLAAIEKSLRASSMLSTTNSVTFFSQTIARDYVEDDHLPFERLGIPVVHLIPTPFPAVWHTVRDDESALDNATITDLTLIFYNFLLEYFNVKEPQQQ